LNIDKAVGEFELPAGAGDGNSNGRFGYPRAAYPSVGLNVPETSRAYIGNVEAASSSNVKVRLVTLYLFCPPTFAIRIDLCPCGPTRRISTSLGNPWLNPKRVTVALVTAWPENPVTVIDDGYGVAAVGGVKPS
jgi:hypothetical protein